MASQPRVARSFALALIVVGSAVVAGCSAGGAAGLATTAIVRLPSGFHVARPDDGPSNRAPARAKPVAIEMATLRLESAHRRAEAAITASAETTSSAAGFVCQIDMGAAPLD